MCLSLFLGKHWSPKVTVIPVVENEECFVSSYIFGQHNSCYTSGNILQYWYSPCLAQLYKNSFRRTALLFFNYLLFMRLFLHYTVTVACQITANVNYYSNSQYIFPHTIIFISSAILLTLLPFSFVIWLTLLVFEFHSFEVMV